MANMPDNIALQRFLIGCGMMSNPQTDLDSFLDLEGEIAGATSEFENLMRFEPFLNTTSAVWKFSPEDLQNTPNRLPWIDLDGGFTSVSAVYVGVSTTSAGTLLTNNVDYFLRPANAVAKGKPYTYIEFNSTLPYSVYTGISYYPDSVQVTGVKGYCTSCPQWAYQAILKRAGARLSDQLQTAITRGLISWKEASGTSETYGMRGKSPVQIAAEGWNREFLSVIRSRRRLTL